MPQLGEERAAEVDSYEGDGGDGLIETGTYLMELVSVSTTKKDGSPCVSEKGPYWVWEYMIPDEDGRRYRKWRQWDRTWEHVDWHMDRAFGAFGVPSSTHTDELIGRRVMVTIDRRIRQDTQETVNYIKALAPLNEGEEVDGGAPTKVKGAAKSEKFQF